MNTHKSTGAKALLATGIIAGLMIVATACETPPVEPVKPKAAPTLPKGAVAEDPPTTPVRPPGGNGG
ncbi:hypothetical protein ACAW74_12985 [Fibrella sp. WM1]|uniref:hypothetical protein n=1 Tax=Fibrella musci TaxID=3242485 RepID=UPI0035227050